MATCTSLAFPPAFQAAMAARTSFAYLRVKGYHHSVHQPGASTSAWVQLNLLNCTQDQPAFTGRRDAHGHGWISLQSRAGVALEDVDMCMPA